MVASIEVKGRCDNKFSRVQETFAENFASKDEIGATVAVYLDGVAVVDLWGGYADAARTKPWEQDTIVTVYSTTKGLTAICAHRLIDQGKLDVDAPVASYWPEFAQAGKADMPVRYLLSHQAGLPAVKQPVPDSALFEWDTMTRALAAQEPWWEPGTRHGYHTLSFGWLVGEVVRRISGKSLGTFLRDEIAGPLGADLYVGLGPEYDHRIAQMVAAAPPPPGVPNRAEEAMKYPDSMQALSFTNPRFITGVTDNTREWRGAEIPGANGHANARGLAKVYGALARGGEIDGVRLMGPETIERALVEQSNGIDAILATPTHFGLGFQLNSDFSPKGPNLRSFGHTGAGGSLGFADPDAKIGFGYAMNQMQLGIAGDPRAQALIQAVYASL